MGNTSIDPKRLLLDLEQELKGLLLEDTFEVLGHKYTLRLLTEEETIWTYGYLNPKSTVSIAVAARLASLSVGLRAVDGYPVSEVFAGEYEALSPAEKDNLHAEHRDPQLVYAALVMGWLKRQPDVFLNELHDAWQTLETRRLEAQGEAKNSSGEDSEKDEKKSSTESSQAGEQFQLDFE